MTSSSSAQRPEPPRRYRCVMVVEAPLTHLMGLSCRHFATLKVASFDRTLTLNERIRLRFHARLCRLCRDFATQFGLINELTRDLESDQALPDAAHAELSADAERINAELRRRIKRT